MKTTKFFCHLQGAWRITGKLEIGGIGEEYRVNRQLASREALASIRTHPPAEIQKVHCPVVQQLTIYGKEVAAAHLERECSNGGVRLEYGTLTTRLRVANARTGGACGLMYLSGEMAARRS